MRRRNLDRISSVKFLVDMIQRTITTIIIIHVLLPIIIIIIIMMKITVTIIMPCEQKPFLLQGIMLRKQKK